MLRTHPKVSDRRPRIDYGDLKSALSHFLVLTISGRLKPVRTGFFQIDLADGVKLECRPHALTEDDKPVYTRTGKIAVNFPFPEDIVRSESGFNFCL